MSSAPSSGEPVPDSNPLLTAYNDWCARTPYITRNTMIGIIIVYLISFYYNPAHALANIPAYTAGHEGLQLYRLFLSPLVGNSIFSILMIMFFFPVMGGKIETLLGSTSYLYMMFLVSFLANVAYVATCYFLWLLGGMAGAMYWRCQGFWLIIFGLITIECLQDPGTPRRLMCIPYDIPGNYFPLALYAFFFLLGGADLGTLLSIGVGYAYVYGYIPQALLLSNTYVDQVLEAPQAGSGNTLGGAGAGGCFLRCKRGVEGAAANLIHRMMYSPGYVLAASAAAGTNLNDNAATNGVAGATPWGAVAGDQGQGEPQRFAGRGHTIGGGGGGGGGGAPASLFSGFTQIFGGGGDSGSGSASSSSSGWRRGQGGGGRNVEEGVGHAMGHNRPGSGLFGAGAARMSADSDQRGAYAPVSTADSMMREEDEGEGEGAAAGAVQMGKVSGGAGRGATGGGGGSSGNLSPRSRRKLLADAASQRLAAMGGASAGGSNSGGGAVSSATAAFSDGVPVAHAVAVPTPAQNTRTQQQQRNNNTNRHANSNGSGGSGAVHSVNVVASAPPMNAASAAVDPAEHAKNIDLLVSMGFAADRSEEALRQCGGNMNDAITMLACE